jgi:hypothetical protein
MASVEATSSCSFYMLHASDYESKEIILQELNKVKINGCKPKWSYPVKSIYCLVTPKELNLEKMLVDLKFNIINEMPRSHGDGKLKLFYKELI